MLQTMRSRRVGHNWATELKKTRSIAFVLSFGFEFFGLTASLSHFVGSFVAAHRLSSCSKQS